MKSSDIIVSVVMITYNQEKYIKQAIDSVLMQKTNFLYELIVGNDCSKDNTKDVLKQIENNNPNKKCEIRIFNHEKNLGVIGNERFVYDQTRGKYVILIEGDDYWIDENKLQKQVDFLEAHPTFSGVAHEQDIVDKDGNFIKKYSDNAKYASSIYRFKDVSTGKMPFQINSLLSRNYFQNHDNDVVYSFDTESTDKIIFAYVADHGDIYIMKDSMSVYRMVKKDEYESVFQIKSNGLKYLTDFGNINFPNHGKINFQKYMNKLIADYYILSFTRKEKRTKEHDKIIKSYTKWPIGLLLINRGIIQICNFLKIKLFHIFQKRM